MPVLIAIIFSALNYYPGENSPFGDIRIIASVQNATEGNYYDNNEVEFVEEVKRTVPEESLIINQPFDGSLFSYGISDLNIYYRDISGYENERETEESKLIRNSLSAITSNNAVKDVVHESGACYVLLLETDQKESDPTYPTYNKDDWKGLQSITDKTPGFEVVLAKDDMRLYKIVA